ncbi:chalcone synthase : Chalcone synthase (CHS) OS=Planctomyces maris DSM 8797 GN=PM8797T_03239 PE=4 SV=1: Chal_sti_synt_N: Chal_sti_synt_C [Gemmata massiliana]|uniref:Chalcone/stilbene synthase C-terminal domain-containing protein n=1 Tax=Gemmata massiliana TaxID=1210884 RepID=A0A6P2DF49_9BACT|nr:type III polyketide synthase [Gemmata massiliana]VTS00280.1 chalcone synthase : Chalcone synthase (CHS) OS=Planctomyces maris DSM 8797 GN=PM8797T_03239 PE=4 SV=1: Chal_sti_synt_N: Chal_sti_synt_C [Gemmata massiliana]
MSFAIHGIGAAHPPDAVTAEEGLALARVLAGPDVRTSTWLGPIYSNNGLRQRFQIIGGSAKRDALAGTNDSGSPFLPTPDNEGTGPTTGERMAIYAQEAGPLALCASTSALAESGFAPDTITHLVTVSCTGFVAPGVDFALITGLGLKPTVARTHVGFMGCHGALNGLRVANAFASADPSARVLVCAVELSSLHYYYGSAADKLIANSIFADGAAAVVGAGGEPTPLAPFPKKEGGTEPNTVGTTQSTTVLSPSPFRGGVGEGFLPPWSLVASGSCLIPNSAADMGWVVGDHGFEMSLSRRVPGLIAAHLKPWIESWLGDNGLSLANVRSWAVHPGGPKIVSAVGEALGLSGEALAPSRGVFAEYGNMSSPTVLFILRTLRAEGAPRPCVALGFGPGLVAEAALFV